MFDIIRASIMENEHGVNTMLSALNERLASYNSLKMAFYLWGMTSKIVNHVGWDNLTTEHKVAIGLLCGLVASSLANGIQNVAKIVKSRSMDYPKEVVLFVD